MSVQNDRDGAPSSPPRDWSWLLGVGVSLAALLVALWGTDARAMVEALARASYVLLLPAYLLQLCGIAARARGWNALLGPAVPYRRAFSAINEGYLLNNVLPFRLGELARAYLVGHDGIGPALALGSIVVERVMDVCIAVLSIVLTIPLFAPPAWATRAALAVGAAAAAIMGLLLLAGRTRDRWMGWLGRLPRLGPRLAEIASRFFAGLQQSRQGGRLPRALGWMLLGWSCAWVQFWIYLRMFGAAGEWGAAIFALGAIALGGAVPSSPGAVGVYELAGVAALTFLGYPREVALGVVIAGHLVQYSLVLVLGGTFLAREGRSVRDLARAARGLVLRPTA
ncbi:MAG TPA: lysylphosphatidylglycerol synthase transmembrane domain-containing protein [Anaerolineales bacterium]|nr:lysylphosphatidylglycerol synthase transmembrane domain-containing protein [Anaerolineales bacterium]